MEATRTNSLTSSERPLLRSNDEENVNLFVCAADLQNKQRFRTHQAEPRRCAAATRLVRGQRSVNRKFRLFTIEN